MIYTALDGTVRDGEVWSPGPVPNSVWLLTPEGDSAAVKFDHLHGGPAVEVHPPNLDAYRAKNWLGEWVMQPRTPGERRAHYLTKYRDAAPLSGPAWRWAVERTSETVAGQTDLFGVAA